MIDPRERIQTQFAWILPHHRHWFFPRTGEMVANCLRILEAESVLSWQYGEDESGLILVPRATIRIDDAASRQLCRIWHNEAFGFSFPEAGFLPLNTDDALPQSLTNCCLQLGHGHPPEKKFSKAIARSLQRVGFAIFPLAVAPFLEDAITDYCLVIVDDADRHELIGLELADDAELFQWTAETSDWPIAAAAEEHATLLWNEEVARTPMGNS